MRVLKPLTLARRRQLAAAHPRPEAPFLTADPSPPDPADIFDLREEARRFADRAEGPLAAE